MSPRRSKENKGLPHRVTKKGPTYYFLKPVIKNGKDSTQWIRLGRTEREMYQRLAELKSEGAGLMSAVIKRYRDEILPRKAKNTQKSQEKQLDRLSRAFGHMRPYDLRPSHIAAYHDLVGQKAPYQANRELALITHVLKYAVRWGYIDENPAREIQRFPEHARKRLHHGRRICRRAQSGPGVDPDTHGPDVYHRTAPRGPAELEAIRS